MVTLIDVHLQSGNISVYWLWFLLDVSTVSVVIVTCLDRNSHCVNVCIFTIRIKSRLSYSETRLKFRVKFPGRPVPNPSKIRWQAKRFKETCSVRNRKVYRWCHVLTEETLDEIGERLEHTLQKSLKHLSQETGVAYLCRLYKEQ